jgi:hypothetical protein
MGHAILSPRADSSSDWFKYIKVSEKDSSNRVQIVLLNSVNVEASKRERKSKRKK